MSDQHPEMERTGFEVAVIGAAGRFPGARNLDEYWDNLCAGLDTISRFSDEELAEAGVSEAQRNHPDYVGAFPAIGDLDQFDAAFFNYSPRETEIIDPQVRLLMESAWHTLEDAGYDPETFPGLIGVFGGSRLSSYVINIYRNPKVYAAHGELAIQFGNDKDYLVNRISYKLDLGGPSVTVQSACSTALVAVHLGCQSLIAGESDIVLAGATTGTTPENRGYQYSEGQVVSKSGVVRPFSADADGTIFGNGVGMMALKRLDDALADGDRVMAVIKGSAVSNDGARKVGYTAPGVDGQRRVIRAAQIAAEVEPDTISYIEAHGTGTNLGDPIEMDALTKAFRERTERVGYCAIGSVKGNIGHLAAAAGVAGMVKAI